MGILKHPLLWVGLCLTIGLIVNWRKNKKTTPTPDKQETTTPTVEKKTATSSTSNPIKWIGKSAANTDIDSGFMFSSTVVIVAVLLYLIPFSPGSLVVILTLGIIGLLLAKRGFNISGAFLLVLIMGILVYVYFVPMHHIGIPTR